MLLKDGENVAIERRRRSVAKPIVHFCFVRLSGCKTEQSDYGRSKSGCLQWHSGLVTHSQELVASRKIPQFILFCELKAGDGARDHVFLNLH